jgi:hypothetical protein
MAIRIFGELPGAFGRGRGFIAASLLSRHRCATKAFPRKTSGPRSTGRQRGSRVACFWATSFGKELIGSRRAYRRIFYRRGRCANPDNVGDWLTMNPDNFDVHEMHCQVLVARANNGDGSDLRR